MLQSQDPVILTALQVIVALLVFGVGLSQVALTVPTPLLRIISRYSPIQYLNAINLWVLFMMIVVLAMFLVRTPAWLECEAVAADSLTCAYINWAQIHAHEIAMTMVIVGAGLVAYSFWTQIRNYRISTVVSLIVAAALGRHWRVSPSGNSSHLTECIRDLGEVGRLAEQDGDKASVLGGLWHLVREGAIWGQHSYDLGRQGNYNPDPERRGLRVLLAAMNSSVDSGSPINYRVALDLFGDLLGRMERNITSSERYDDVSIKVISPYLSMLGRKAIALEDDDLDVAIMGQLQGESDPIFANVMFDWSRAALRLERGLVSMTFFGRLGQLAEAGSAAQLRGAPSSEVLFFIGLAAYFCSGDGTVEGITRRTIGWERLADTFDGPSSDFDTLLDRSISFFRGSRGDFETTDKIIALKAAVSQRREALKQRLESDWGVTSDGARIISTHFFSLESEALIDAEYLRSIGLSEADIHQIHLRLVG